MNPKLKETIKEYVKSFIIAFILAMAIKTFVIQAFKIPTGSMIPTLNIGDRLLANKFIYRFREPERGDIIIFKGPIDPDKDFIKRVVGLPGDTVEIRNGIIHINGEMVDVETLRKYYYYNDPTSDYGKEDQKIYVPKDGLFVLGDNSQNSRDSRYWGFVPRRDVKGKALLVYWPLNKMRLLK